MAGDEVCLGIDEGIAKRSAEKRGIKNSRTAVHRAQEFDERGRAGLLGTQALDRDCFERELRPQPGAEFLIEQKLRDGEVIKGFRHAVIHAHETENKTGELESFGRREAGKSREAAQGF